MNKSIDIQYICHLIYQTFSVPVHFLSVNKDFSYEFTSNDRCSPFYSSKKEQLIDLYRNNAPYNFPLIKANRYLENFVLLHIVDHEYVEGTLIIGPTAYPRLSEDMVMKLMNEFGSVSGIQDGINYYHSVPTINKITLIHISILLYQMIYNEKLDVSTVWKKNKLLEETSYPTVNPDLYISSRRQNNSAHYDISLEKQFFMAVKEGNKEKLIEYAYAFPQEDAVTLSANQLSNQKNNGIIAITLATRYAIDGNLPSEIAFSLSALYIQTLEQLDNMNSVNRLIEDALCTFAEF